jgi:hypothetical protein
MMRVPPGGTILFDADPDEDTIEMVLTPADRRLLAQAAEEQQRAAASAAEPLSHLPTTDSTLPSMPGQTTRTDNSMSLARGALAGFAGALVIVIAMASLSTTRLATATKPSPPPQTPKLVATAAAAAPAPVESPPPPVAEAQPLRFKNPFDKSEVFEFPPGTTPEEARASVADLLMQRAQDRHIRPGLQHSRVSGPIPRRSAKRTEFAQVPKRG